MIGKIVFIVLSIIVIIWAVLDFILWWYKK